MIKIKKQFKIILVFLLVYCIERYSSDPQSNFILVHIPGGPRRKSGVLGSTPSPCKQNVGTLPKSFKFKLNLEFYMQAQSCFVGQNCLVRIFWTTHILTIPRTAHMRDLSALLVYHSHLYFCFVRLKTAAASLVHFTLSFKEKKFFKTWITFPIWSTSM